MTRRVLSGAVLLASLAVPAAAQDGQGANARPDATPPTRPSTLTPPGSPGPLPRFQIIQPRSQNLLLIYPSVQPTLLPLAQATGPVYEMGPGVTAPVRIKTVDPVYTFEARNAGIQGEVWIDGIVETDGKFTVLSVRKSLDPVLDTNAIEAAKGWQFKPGMRDGQPVRVKVQLIVEFRLTQTRPSDRVGFRGDSTPIQVPISDAEFRRGAHLMTEPGVIEPKAKRRIDPKYTSEAMRAKIQGIVVIEAVVMPDGTVGRARIVDSLDKVLGLDANALEAVNQSTFEPGTLNGMPVPVLITLTLEFRLH